MFRVLTLFTLEEEDEEVYVRICLGSSLFPHRMSKDLCHTYNGFSTFSCQNMFRVLTFFTQDKQSAGGGGQNTFRVLTFST